MKGKKTGTREIRENYIKLQLQRSEKAMNDTGSYAKAFWYGYNIAMLQVKEKFKL